jgi:hypothetical protein
MFKEFTRLDIAIAVVAMIVATALTILGTNYVLHRFVLDNPNDPLTHQGGLKPESRNCGEVSRSSKITKVARMTPTIPRGTIIGERVGGPLLTEAEHF